MANDALWSIHSGRREGSGGPAIPQSFPPRSRPRFGVCLGRARKPTGASGPLFPASPSLLLHKVVHGPSGRPGWRRDRDFSREIESLRAWSASRGSRAQLIRSELVHGKADRAWALVRSHGVWMTPSPFGAAGRSPSGTYPRGTRPTFAAGSAGVFCARCERLPTEFCTALSTRTRRTPALPVAFGGPAMSGCARVWVTRVSPAALAALAAGGRRWRGKPRQFGVGGPAGPEAHRFHVEPHRLRPGREGRGRGRALVAHTALHVSPALARPASGGRAQIGIGEGQATDPGAVGRTSGASSAQFFPQGQDGRGAELCIDSPGKSCDLARVSGRRPLQFSTKFSTRNRRRCLAHPCRAACVAQRGEPRVLHRLVHGLGQQGRFFGRQRVGRIACSRVRDTRVLHMFIHAEPRRVAAQNGCQGAGFFWGQLCGEIASTIRRRPLGQGWPCEEVERRFPRFPYDATAGGTAFSELGAGPRPWTRSRLRVERLWVHLWISGQLQEPIPDYRLESRVALVLAQWCGPPWNAGRKGSIRLAAQCQRVRAQRVFEAAAQLDATACGVPVPLFHVKPSPG